MSDKRINKIVKRFMDKRPFKLVESFKEANVLLVFDRNNLQDLMLCVKKIIMRSSLLVFLLILKYII